MESVQLGYNLKRRRTKDMTTPTPWAARTTYSNGEPSGMIIEHTALNITLSHEECPLSDESYNAITELENAVNHHAMLVEALEEVINYWHSNEKNFERKEPKYLQMARQALAVVKGA
jgi:hypothetical protein